jgi:hypothetical protein
MEPSGHKETAAAHIDYIDAHKLATKPVVGTIRLFDEDGIILIPTPSNDPNGAFPMNWSLKKH